MRVAVVSRGRGTIVIFSSWDRGQEGTRECRRPIRSAKTAGKAASTKPGKVPAKPAAAPKPVPLKPPPAVADDVPVIALNLAPAKLSPAMAAYFKKCQDKLGFVPNVLVAYAFDMPKLETFVAHVQRPDAAATSGLSKLEREMIAVAVSSQNRCYYCLTAHGAAMRQYSGNPLLGEQIVMNYRAARLTKRQRAMLDFAVKLTASPGSVEEADRERLRRAGFTDRDIWDISAVAGFFNMSNRVASGHRHAAECGVPRAGQVAVPSAHSRASGNPARNDAIRLGPRFRGDKRKRKYDLMARVLAIVIGLLCSLAAHAQVAPGPTRADRSAGARHPCRQRHGGGAGEPRRARRRRDPRPRRQCGGCRGRGRLCARGDLSARRQYRRRRLHGDPSRRTDNRDMAIDYRETAPAAIDADHVPRCDRAMPIRPSRATARLAIGVPGTVAGLALAQREIRLRQIVARRTDRAGDRSRARRLPVEDDSPTRCRGARSAWRAGRRRRAFSSTATAAARRRPADPVRPRRHAEGYRARRPARVLRGADRRAHRRRRRKAGGIMTEDDLEAYRPVERAVGARHAIAATTSSPCRRPRRAASHLIEMLNILEGYDLGQTRHARRRCTE